MTHMIATETAIALLTQRGLVAKRSKDGRTLRVYTGEVDAPGTWMEVAKTLIDAKSDAVSRHALRDWLRGEKP